MKVVNEIFLVFSTFFTLFGSSYLEEILLSDCEFRENRHVEGCNFLICVNEVTTSLLSHGVQHVQCCYSKYARHTLQHTH